MHILFKKKTMERPNFPPLAHFGIDLEIEERLFLPAPRKAFKIHKELFTNIIVFWLIPGFSDEMLEAVLKKPEEKGVVLAFYGMGNYNSKKTFYDLLKQAKENWQCEIVLMSQCQKGHVDSSFTNPKNTLTNVLINGNDMTGLLFPCFFCFFLFFF